MQGLMMSLFLGVSAALLTLTAGQSDLVPSREYGFIYKEGRLCAPVKVAAYMDLTCPDSQRVYPTLTKMADECGPYDVQLIVHQFSLPYHRNSHTISKATHVIDQFHPHSPTNATAFDWISTVYDNMGRLTTSATTEMTDSDVLNVLSGLAEKVSGIASEQFLKSVVEDWSIDMATRLEWKYGCTRGVYGTPMFTVNDVFLDAAAAEWTTDQWITYIKKLIRNSSKSNSGHCHR